MTREKDHSTHPAPRRNRVEVHEAIFSVCAAPLAWMVQLSAVYAFSSAPCFAFGARLFTHPGVQPWPLIIGCACLLVSLAALWLGIVLLRRTEGEKGGGTRRLFETGHGRTRFMASWGIAFSAVFSALIVLNIVLLLGMPVCES